MYCMEGFYMINSTAFNYVNLLGKAADASWTRETLLANNIANVDTPNYKRKDIDFQSVLEQQLGRCKHMSLDDKVKNLDFNSLNASVYTDMENFSYRLDGNNVDIDTENVELASEQIKYKALATSISSEFERMRKVIK